MSNKNKIQKTKINRRFFKIALPSVLSMWVYTIYTMVDGIFVARGVGEEALAAVNLSMPLIGAAFGLALLWAVGASTRASIYRGRGNQAGANHVFTLSNVTVFLVGLALSLLTLVQLDDLARFLGSGPATHAYVQDYLSLLALFFPFYMASYNLEVLIKADGHPRKAAGIILLGALTNIILDYLLVIHYAWGIRGAALATGLSQLISFSFFLAHFLGPRSKFHFAPIRFRIRDSLALARLGLADSLTEFSLAFTTFLFNRVLLKNLGTDGVVIYTVISYAYQLVMMTMMGFNQGMQPLVSYYHGRQEPQTARQLLRLGLASTGLAALGAFVLAQAYPHRMLQLFLDPSHQDLFHQGLAAFRLFSLAYLPLGWVIIFYGYLAAIEKPRLAVIISLARGWVLVALALLILPLLLGSKGICLSLFFSESLSLILALVLIKKFSAPPTSPQVRSWA